MKTKDMCFNIEGLKEECLVRGCAPVLPGILVFFLTLAMSMGSPSPLSIAWLPPTTWIFRKTFLAGSKLPNFFLLNNSTLPRPARCISVGFTRYSFKRFIPCWTNLSRNATQLFFNFKPQYNQIANLIHFLVFCKKLSWGFHTSELL